MNIKQLSASVLLPACLALAPLTASAEGVDGASGGVDLIETTTFDTLECVNVTTGASGLACAATCSAEANNPGNAALLGSFDYELAVTSGGVIVGFSERDFQFVSTPDEDIDVIEVSTTGAFDITPNITRTICCSAAKETNSAADPTLTIADSSMSIVCDEAELSVPDLPNVP